MLLGARVSISGNSGAQIIYPQCFLVLVVPVYMNMYTYFYLHSIYICIYVFLYKSVRQPARWPKRLVGIVLRQ